MNHKTMQSVACHLPHCHTVLGGTRGLVNKPLLWMSHLNLVDLAGSENAKQAGTSDRISTLSNVIRTLCKKDKAQIRRVRYRDSQLTRLLKTALGGSSRTAMICCVTPAADSETQTVCTLRFAIEHCDEPSTCRRDERAQVVRDLQKELREMSDSIPSLQSDRRMEA